MSTSPSALEVWQELGKLAVNTPAISECLDDESRNARLRFDVAGLHADLSKQRVTNKTLDALLVLARNMRFAEQRQRLLDGAHINTSEDRPALHTALRTPQGEGLAAYEETVVATHKRVAALVDDLTTGALRGVTGKTIRDIIHIGIGGSQLGPEVATTALGEHRRFRMHYVANIDGEAIARVLAQCDPERTAVFIVSKSFRTLETLENARTVRSWLMERLGTAEAIAQQCFAISADLAATQAFGITDDHVLPIWDWVGGRYSVWSAVGIPIALAHGNAAFAQMRSGARDMDEHFAQAEDAANLPLIAALIGIWNTNFLGATSHLVLAYDDRLVGLPMYLQQLETESNGKSVQLDGTPVDTHTMPILWGGVGTTGQHAYHQLLHQGTRAYSADFIFTRFADHNLAHHHRWLQANALAQSQAMMAGENVGRAEQHVPGNHPTSTLVLEQMDAHSLGALLAFYEHKVFCQGVIWNINSFDQWGVELGKRLATPIYKQLAGASTLSQDASTRNLITHLTGDSKS